MPTNLDDIHDVLVEIKKNLNSLLNREIAKQQAMAAGFELNPAPEDPKPFDLPPPWP